MLKIDIGCGDKKRYGYVGVDLLPGKAVDHIVDIDNEPLPFKDRSVDKIFSSHCFEHLQSQAHIFKEISRVAKDGATLEIWTPYAWSDEAMMYDHKTNFTKLHYLCKFS